MHFKKIVMHRAAKCRAAAACCSRISCCHFVRHPSPWPHSMSCTATDGQLPLTTSEAAHQPSMRAQCPAAAGKSIPAPSPQRDSVDQYADIAGVYQDSVLGEPLWTHTTDATIKQLILGDDECAAGALKSKSVIDLACGEGVLSRWAFGVGARRVVGVDLSPNLLQLGRKAVAALGPTAEAAIEFVAGDMRNPGAVPPHFAGQFDVAFAVHCFCFAQNYSELVAMLRTASHALKPGGRLVGVRECLDSKSLGPAPVAADTSRGSLRFAYTLFNEGHEDGGGRERTTADSNGSGSARRHAGAGLLKCFGDFCQCKFEFGEESTVHARTVTRFLGWCDMSASPPDPRCCPRCSHG